MSVRRTVRASGRTTGLLTRALIGSGHDRTSDAAYTNAVMRFSSEITSYIGIESCAAAAP